ncbi:two-component sensor histidine kinase [Polymorphobacter sp. PAMC 29334]|uniref:two-component system sensor histidine kinase NtrB n=1 Tax=Polymorphobacter sp. PAMC 29334 TaxID=2862331 RepID=UPI001C772FE6|nr:histidine kinase dimerization/phospho-acceptor domain-containing protein [Polymorphobacter sp. PAMC 29334]QYE34217.1 two-component sensor histidine kinase [Polymorphobacter sp. PAMC 29334]
MSVFPLLRRAGKAKPTVELPPVDLLATLPIPVIVLGPDGGLALANAAAETLLNASQASLIERGWSSGLTPGSSLVAFVADARGHGGPITAFDTELAFIGGRTARADVFITPLADAPDWTTVCFQARPAATLVDRQLVHQGAARSAIGVAAMLAHEIKNPLSGIRGAAQLLAANADPEARELTELIRDEVDRVAALIDRMEGFTDTRPVAKAAENIHSVLGHVRRVAESGFASGIMIRERYDPSLPAVAGNRDALIQVFLNLVKNAAEAIVSAGGSAGEITLTTAYRHGVRVATEGSGVRVSLPLEVCVIDTGAGAGDVARHMFEPFVSSKRAGGGLGLALVAKIVSDHGGIVEYERSADPPRTVLRVLLPMAPA